MLFAIFEPLNLVSLEHWKLLVCVDLARVVFNSE